MHKDLRRELAQLLMSVPVKERLPTMRDLATKFGVSIGAVHAVLSEYERGGAISLLGNGRRGTFLSERSIGLLWSLTEETPLVIALPLPTTLRAEGLATGLKTVLADAGVPAFMIFLRGSRRRLQALRQRKCHLAVISMLGAKAMLEKDQVCLLNLPAQSFVGEHRVFYLPQEQSGKRPLRVLMDRDSGDLQLLTELEFQNTNVEFVQASFMQFAPLLKTKLVDTVVWDVDEANNRLSSVPVLSRPLSNRVIQQIGDTNTRATLVAQVNDLSSAAVVDEIVNVEKLMEIQNEVLRGERIPEY